MADLSLCWFWMLSEQAANFSGVEMGCFCGQVSEPSSEIPVRNALKTVDSLSSPSAQTCYRFQVEPFRPFPAVPSVILNKVGLLWASSHIGCMDFAYRYFLQESMW